MSQMYSPEEIETLRKHVQKHIAQDEQYARERVEAIEIKKEQWLDQIIRQVITQQYGWVPQSVFNVVKSIVKGQQK